MPEIDNGCKKIWLIASNLLNCSNELLCKTKLANMENEQFCTLKWNNFEIRSQPEFSFNQSEFSRPNIWPMKGLYQGFAPIPKTDSGQPDKCQDHEILQ